MPYGNSAGGGGAASSADRVAVKLAANTAVNGNGATIPFDTVYYDAASYFDAVNFQFVIPSGKDGVFLFGLESLLTADVTITSGNVTVAYSGSLPDLTIPLTLQGTANPILCGALVLQMAAGDTLRARLFLGGAASAVVRGGFSSTFWLVRISA